MDIDLVEYRPELRPDFERLNRIWLEQHSLLEPVDLEYLREPERLILAHGGQVFFAMKGEAVVGTCAAIPISATTWELAKLAVDPSTRGLGIGRRLCEAVLAYARAAGATEIVLTSHTALVEAIRLYETLGFRHAPLPADVRYETANVYMQLILSTRLPLKMAGPEGRLRIASDLSDAERELAIAGIRKRHPEYTPREVIEALVWQIHKIRLPKPESE